jgi:hypothetical protein
MVRREMRLSRSRVPGEVRGSRTTRPLSRTYGDSTAGASRSSGHVLNDQHLGLVGVVVADAHHAQRLVPEVNAVARTEEGDL